MVTFGEAVLGILEDGAGHTLTIDIVGDRTSAFLESITATTLAITPVRPIIHDTVFITRRRATRMTTNQVVWAVASTLRRLNQDRTTTYGINIITTTWNTGRTNRPTTPFINDTIHRAILVAGIMLKGWRTWGSMAGVEGKDRACLLTNLETTARTPFTPVSPVANDAIHRTANVIASTAISTLGALVGSLSDRDGITTRLAHRISRSGTCLVAR